MTFWCCILAVIVFTLFQFHFWGFVPLMCCLVDVGWPLARSLSRFFVLLYKGYVSLFLLTYLLCCLPHACYSIKLFGATFKVCLSRLWLFDYFNGKVRRFSKSLTSKNIHFNSFFVHYNFNINCAIGLPKHRFTDEMGDFWWHIYTFSPSSF